MATPSKFDPYTFFTDYTHASAFESRARRDWLREKRAADVMRRSDCPVRVRAHARNMAACLRSVRLAQRCMDAMLFPE